MGRQARLLQVVAVLCLSCCGVSNASPTMFPELPPLPPAVEERDGGEAGEAEIGYLLTMPQRLQAGAMEQYCVTLHGVSEDRTITLELEEVEKDVLQDYTHTYVNGESQCNTFRVPGMPGRYEVRLLDGNDTLATSEVEVLGNNLITFVQTDKPIYKPGDKVKFRILTMTRDLRARTGEIENVFIKDPNDYIVKQYKNVDSRGMASLEFTRTAAAKLGDWKIEVTVDGEKTTQKFTVDEYVLPRFEVTIDPPAYVLISSDAINGTVCAKYTYGKPVSGYARLQFCAHGYRSFAMDCANRDFEIDGCQSFSVSTSEVLNSEERHFFVNSISITARVTERETAVEVNKTASVQLTYDPLKLTFHDDTNGYFKPGMPIHGRVQVTKPDGSPAVNEPILVYAQDYRNNVYLAKNFTTNDMGEVHYSLCEGVTENTTSLSLNAEAENYRTKEYSRRMSTPTAYSSFKQWFSPSFSYIQIPARRDPLQCGSTLQLNVPFTHNGLKPYIKFYYQVMSRGRIVHSSSTEAPTLPDPLSYLEPSVDNCLEVAEKPTVPPPPTPPPPPSSTPAPPPPLLPVDDDEGEVAPTPPEEGGEEGESSSFVRTSVREPPIINPPLAPTEGGEEGESSSFVRTSVREPPIVDPPLVEEVPAEPEMIGPVMIQPLSEMVDPIFTGDRAERVRRKRFSPPMYHIEDEPVDIVRSENPADRLSNVQLSIPITTEMSPSFSILLFYIRDDGETVADSMEFKVEPCFDNEVKMEFSKDTVLPGDEMTVHLEAAAGSVCGIGVVDKSVNILGGDHQITPEKVFKKLAEYSLSSRGQYSYFRSDNTYCKDKVAEKEAKEKEEESPDDEDGDGEEGPPVFSYMPDNYASNYVDAIQAFKQMGMLVLTNLDVETRPCFRSYPVYYDFMGLPGPMGGPVPVAVQSSLQIPGLRGSAPSKKTRSNFPETWLWDLQIVGESGDLDLPYTAPDTITKWVGNSLCVSDTAGFGLSPITSITTFQPFFLAFNLPYNAVRGERLPITITVYNYLDKCLHMMLMVDGQTGFKVHRYSLDREPFCLCGGESETKKIYITAQDIGKLPIFAEASVVPGQCGNAVAMDTQYVGRTDRVERQVLVKAEGVTQRYTNSLFICPDEGEAFRDQFEVPLPSDMVPDSARGDITVIGDIMGPALSNLDHLVRMPTGCGEQNMVGFTPNIYVLKYLTATGQLSEIMEDTAKNYMEIGYQRELTYRHSDGSYSAFGERGGNAGSTWLTAFVVKSFAQARPYIFIDELDLELSVDYLKTTQNPEDGPLKGCFFETGKVFSSYMQGGLGRDSNIAALSAYVLTALLEFGLSADDMVAKNAIECINREVQQDVDVYTLSLVAYVNTLYDPANQTTEEIMAMLEEKATVDGDIKHWKREGEQPKPVNTWCYIPAPSAEVEMTSYALMATMNFYVDDAVSRAQPIAYWLSKQRNAFGGFSSTQDTVLGLNALSEFAALAFSDQPTNVRLTMGNGKFATDFNVTEDNILVLQRHLFEVTSNATMRVTATGTGCALVQTNVYYNKLPQHLGIDDPKFLLRVAVRKYQANRNKCDHRTIYITYGMRDTDQYSTGMTLLTVRMVTGWSPKPESLRALRSKFPILGIERMEHNEEEGVISFYLDELDTRYRRLDLDVVQDQERLVSSPKPAEVQIYQYYETDVTVIQSYGLRTTCGTKQELPYDEPDDGSETDPLLISQRRQPIGPPPTFNLRRTTTATTTPKAPSCPVCNLVEVPENFNEIVCNSTAVYKAHAGRNRKFSLKIKANLRPRRKLRDLKVFANIEMEEGCQCSLLDPPMKQVLIITQAANLNVPQLKVDSRTYVFNLKKLRGLERTARKAQRRCRMD